jgi:hypothetical protein
VPKHEMTRSVGCVGAFDLTMSGVPERSIRIQRLHSLRTRYYTTLTKTAPSLPWSHRLAASRQTLMFTSIASSTLTFSSIVLSTSPQKRISGPRIFGGVGIVVVVVVSRLRVTGHVSARIKKAEDS